MKSVRYIVQIGGTKEENEYTAHCPVELSNGSLQWVDTAGISHIAPTGTWYKEKINESRR